MSKLLVSFLSFSWKGATSCQKSGENGSPTRGTARWGTGGRGCLAWQGGRLSSWAVRQPCCLSGRASHQVCLGGQGCLSTAPVHGAPGLPVLAWNVLACHQFCLASPPAPWGLACGSASTSLRLRLRPFTALLLASGRGLGSEARLLCSCTWHPVVATPVLGLTGQRQGMLELRASHGLARVARKAGRRFGLSSWARAVSVTPSSQVCLLQVPLPHHQFQAHRKQAHCPPGQVLSAFSEDQADPTGGWGSAVVVMGSPLRAEPAASKLGCPMSQALW